MTDTTVERSPQVYARTAGVLYLYIIVAGIFAEILGIDRLVVSGDAAATANNLMAHESLFRASVTIHLTWLVCAVIVVLILYLLLKPVSNAFALMAAFFNLVSIAVECVTAVNLFSALFFLGDARYLKAFEPNQLHALSYLAIKSYNYGFGASLVFFACCLFLYGYLVFQSGFLPKTIGVLLILASISYLINSFTLFLAPENASSIFPILVLGFIGELSFCLWLIVKGVDVPKWEAKANAMASRGA